ncbi:MAG TPA: hypothetical protein VGV92_08350 [Gammaproteobacteria bacterium]|nr:hypothetical protein [Gammaproteobacteria bacterium]
MEEQPQRDIEKQEDDAPTNPQPIPTEEAQRHPLVRVANILRSSETIQDAARGRYTFRLYLLLNLLVLNIFVAMRISHLPPVIDTLVYALYPMSSVAVPYVAMLFMFSLGASGNQAVRNITQALRQNPNLPLPEILREFFPDITKIFRAFLARFVEAARAIHFNLTPPESPSPQTIHFTLAPLLPNNNNAVAHEEDERRRANELTAVFDHAETTDVATFENTDTHFVRAAQQYTLAQLSPLDVFTEARRHQVALDPQAEPRVVVPDEDDDKTHSQQPSSNLQQRKA